MESNHCASRHLQVWSLQPGPPSVIWTFYTQFLFNFSFCQNLNISTAANWSTIGKLKRVGSRCTLTIERINFVHFKGVWKSYNAHKRHLGYNFVYFRGILHNLHLPIEGEKVEGKEEEEAYGWPVEALGSGLSIQLWECDRGRWSQLASKRKILKFPWK